MKVRGCERHAPRIAAAADGLIDERDAGRISTGEYTQDGSVSLSEIRILARAGATEAAWALFESEPRGGIDALTLKGRLLKERAASAHGAARSMLLREAGEAYAEAARAAPATYPMINAATLSLLGGARARAAQLAADTLALLESGAHAPDTRYWLTATRAEALLLLDREVEARAALREAIAGTPRAWEDHAVTLRQFRLILAEQNRPAAWLDACRPPAPTHFAGPIGVAAGDTRLAASIEAAIAANGAGIAVGALAAGFDIVAAELLVRAGAELHVMLPAAPAAFIAASVAPAGDSWCSRFEALLAEAAQVDILDLPAGLSTGAAALGEEMAIGCAIRNARLLDVETTLLRLAGSGRPPSIAHRPGIRWVEVPGGATGAGGLDLPRPDRAITLLGCRHGTAARLTEITGAPAQIVPAGAVVVLDDLAAAANLAMTLFDATDAARVVLDHLPPLPDGSPDTTTLAALLAIPPRGYPLATRSATLVLEARGAPFRLALAGAREGTAGPVEFFSLWRGG